MQESNILNDRNISKIKKKIYSLKERFVRILLLGFRSLIHFAFFFEIVLSILVYSIHYRLFGLTYLTTYLIFILPLLVLLLIRSISDFIDLNVFISVDFIKLTSSHRQVLVNPNIFDV